MRQNQRSIKISPKHGINATTCSCFYCGRPTNDLALMGRIKRDGNNDAKAPKGIVINYDPCDACIQEWSAGIACIGVTPTQPDDGRPPIKQTKEVTETGQKKTVSLYPTGSYIVLTADAMERIFEQKMEPGSCVLMEQRLVEQFVNADKTLQNNGGQVEIEIPVQVGEEC